MKGRKVMKVIFIFMILISMAHLTIAQSFEKEIISTSKGDLEITFIGHGSLMLKYDGKIIHIDPFSRLADYTKFPKANVIFLTHHHGDHLDAEALQQVRMDSTIVILTEICAKKVEQKLVPPDSKVVSS